MSKLSKMISIDLDKPRNLLYNLNAMVAYERATGKNFLAIGKEDISATLVMVVLWAGLIHEDKTLTVEQVGAMIDADNMLTIQQKIVEASSANTPVPETKEGNELPLEVKSEIPA